MNGRASRVALVNPPHITPLNPEFESGVPPLGLCSIAAYIRTHGFTCDVFDLAEEWPLNVAKLKSSGLFRYNVFGVTSYTKNFSAAEAVIRELRLHAPDSVIVLGGPHASAVPEQVLSNTSNVNFVIRNEGEESLLKLLLELSKAMPNYGSVPNLVYMGDDGTLTFSSENTKFDDLESYPPPIRDMKFGPSRDVVTTTRAGIHAKTQYFSSSRGCPKRCNFCSIIVMSPKYRYRSVSSLLSEIKSVRAKHPFQHISFVDANFFAHSRRALDFSEALYDYDPTMTWSGTATTDNVCRQWEGVLRMGDLNCVALEIGIENGSDAVLNRFNKGTTVAENLACIEIVRAANIKLELDYILFDPLSTTKELSENIEFISKASLTAYLPSHFLYSATKLYPGTTARAEYQQRFPLRGDFFGIPPFQSKITQAIYDAQIYFARRYLSRIEKSIADIEVALEKFLQDRGTSFHIMETLSTLIIQLRQAPFSYLNQLVEQQSWIPLFSGGNWLESPSIRSIEALLCSAARESLHIADKGALQHEPPTIKILESNGASFLLSNFERPIELTSYARKVLDAYVVENFGATALDPIKMTDSSMKYLMTKIGVGAAKSGGH